MRNLEAELGDLGGAESEFKAELATTQLSDGDAEMARFATNRTLVEAADQLAKSKSMTPELLYMLCDSYFHLAKRQMRLECRNRRSLCRNNPNS